MGHVRQMGHVDISPDRAFALTMDAKRDPEWNSSVVEVAWPPRSDVASCSRSLGFSTFMTSQRVSSWRPPSLSIAV